jgi:hypothetical protein
MAANDKLFMVLLGCRPKGRLTEQHDVFFGIGPDLKSLIPQMNEFWPGSGGLHIDAWREITIVNGYKIAVQAKSSLISKQELQLFFINLGGYKVNEFEEYHYKILCIAQDSTNAIKQSKQTAFYKHTGIKTKGGVSHVDDKYGIDVDDLVKVDDALSPELKNRYSLKLSKTTSDAADELHIGYISLSKLK